MKDIYKILEKLQKNHFRIELEDWGSFYTRQVFPHKKKEEKDEFEVWRGFYVSPDLEVYPARLFVLTMLDGRRIPDYFFYFQVLDRDCNILATNI